MNSSLSFKIESNFAELQKLLDEITSELKKIGLAPESIRKIKLIIEELLTNTIKYGDTNEGKGLIELNIFLNRKSLRMELCDDAKPFDPIEYKSNSPSGSIENLKIGGLGLIIVKKSCRRMKYERYGDKNLLSLTVPISFT